MKTTSTKKPLSVLAVFFFSAAFLFCQQKATETPVWTLAASVFKLEAAETLDPVLEAAAKLIPRLILEECVSSGDRLVSPAEEASRELYKQQIERNKLYSELSQQIRTRDSLVLSAKERSSSALKKSIKEQEKKITEIKQKIETNMNLERKITEASLSASAQKIPVVIWKNDSSQYYEKKHDLANPYADGISGLITGSLSRRGDYMSVSVVLTTYPLGSEQLKVSEIGGVNDARSIAKSIANQLYPAIINDIPAVLRITIEPPEAAEGAEVHINGSRQKFAPIISVTSGPNSLYITSSGYESAQMRFTFESAQEYKVSVVLKPVEVQEVLFTSAQEAGSLFLQAIPRGDTPAEVKVSGMNILGEFVSETGQSTFFQFTLPENRKNPAGMLSVNIVPNATDIAAGIEKTRKALYTSYGALLLSLPFSYLSYGAYVNSYNAWASGFGSESERDYWKATSDVTMGISIGCGVLFAAQLGRYLFMANKVIPKQITLDGIKINY